MSRDAQTIIDMLLMKLKDSLSHEAVVQCSVLDCVRKAIAEYPGSENLKDRIILATEQDFYFAGSERLLVHVLFNLFKNALEASSGSEIYIWTDKKPDDHYHTLHICDTGGGMRSQDKAVLFKAFQSKKRYGTGLGLAFCRLAMRTLNGTIECSTGQGAHTEFVLSFPML
jgi:two-component system CAI-1 autoinducer sensor kinase/phosphatase CqsS